MLSGMLSGMLGDMLSRVLDDMLGAGPRSTRRTKIVATIGPASASMEMLEALAQQGMNIARCAAVPAIEFVSLGCATIAGWLQIACKDLATAAVYCSSNGNKVQQPQDPLLPPGLSAQHRWISLLPLLAPSLSRAIPPTDLPPSCAGST